jgi:hypothetical protein
VSNPAVFLQCVGENENVIEIYGGDTFGDQVLEYLIHHHLEGGWTIGEAEVHDQGFK